MKSDGWDPLGWKEVLMKLNLEAPPVGVSFFIKPPEGVNRLEDNMRLCEMLKRSHEGHAFYADPEKSYLRCGALHHGEKRAVRLHHRRIRSGSSDLQPYPGGQKNI